MPTFAEAKAEHDRLDREFHEAGEALRAFPRGQMGLVPDAVRATPAYRAAKTRSDKAFAALRKFNQTFVRTFAKELRAERRARRPEVL